MLKTVGIKGKKYVEVNERLKFFRTEEKYKDYSLESEIIALENGVITIKAIIKDGKGNVKATGLAQEKESSSFINKTSFVENCETSAWGRALGNLGIGIDTSVATADEVMNAINNQQPDINPDIDLIEGLKACSAYSELAAYYKKNFENVHDKEAFNQLATELKKEFMDKEIFEGLKACSSYSELLAYCEANLEKVHDKEAFNKLAAKLKAKLKAKEEVKNG